MSDSRYRAFVTTVDVGSITAAAEKLGYTQSGVSHLIDALENELGITLLRRMRRGVELTPEGTRMLPYIKSLVRAADTVTEAADDIRGVRSGSIRIGTFSSVAIQWLPRILSEYMRRYPGIEVHVTNGTYSTIEEGLHDHSMDCAFVTLPQSEDVHVTLLAEDPLMAVLPVGHRLSGRESVEPTDIEDEDFIIPAEGQHHNIGSVFAQMSHEPVVRFDMSDDFAAIEMVRNGLGITVLPQLLIKDLPMDRLVAIPIHGTMRKIGIATPDDYASPAVRAFTKLCTESV